MANLKEVKNRIQSVTSTQQITKAMKMVAAAKLRKAQDRITQLRPYSKRLTGIIQNLSASVDPSQIHNPYAEEREIHRVLIVVVSSDRGLCGAFNSSVFKGTKALIEEKYKDLYEGGSVTILPIGKKAFEHFRKRDYKVIGDYAHLISNLDFSHVKEAVEFIFDKFTQGTYDRVEVIYNEFKNVATQVLVKEQFLPVSTEAIAKEEGTANSVDYIFEPGKEEIFSEVIPKSLKIQFYKSLLESNASEQGARMTAMDKATDNAGELLKELRLTYNRTRQAAITKEILEIVGGAEALSQG